MVAWGICGFEQAVQMATTNPARLLRLDGEYGAIHPGCRADLVLWDRERLAPCATWVDGKLLWCDSHALKGAPQPQQRLQIPHESLAATAP